MTASVTQMVQEATEAANQAGTAWLEKATVRFNVFNANMAGKAVGNPLGQMLDVCGNAHVQFSDKRSSFYKQFVKADLVRRSGNAVVEIQHKFKSRQEYGLATACAEAARKKLEEHGITGLRIWSYVD